MSLSRPGSYVTFMVRAMLHEVNAMGLALDRKKQLDKRLVSVSVDEFKQMVQNRTIRSASMEDILGIHHQRPLYRHPNTGHLWVEVK